MRYLTNRELAARGFDAIRPGFEIVTTATGVAVAFWHGFFVAGTIIDRTDGKPARRQVVGRVTKNGDRYTYQTHPGVRGAIRYGSASTEEAAIADVVAWLGRRFAHVTPRIENEEVGR